MDDDELAEIKQRAALAFALAPTPWIAQLETRQAIGGESFIQLGDDPDLDQSCTSGCTPGLMRSSRPTSALMPLSTSLPTPPRRSRDLWPADTTAPQPLYVRIDGLICRRPCALMQVRTSVVAGALPSEPVPQLTDACRPSQDLLPKALCFVVGQEQAAHRSTVLSPSVQSSSRNLDVEPD